MLILAGLVAGALATTAYAQDTGTVRGEVTFIASGDQVHGAVVLVVGPSLVALTDENGVFEIPACSPTSTIRRIIPSLASGEPAPSLTSCSHR